MNNILMKLAGPRSSGDVLVGDEIFLAFYFLALPVFGDASTGHSRRVASSRV